MVRMIMEGKYSFASPEWDDVSENAKDLVRSEAVIIKVSNFILMYVSVWVHVML